jgi:hypothetical protein
LGDCHFGVSRALIVSEAEIVFWDAFITKGALVGLFETDGNLIVIRFYATETQIITAFRSLSKEAAKSWGLLISMGIVWIAFDGSVCFALGNWSASSKNASVAVSIEG